MSAVEKARQELIAQPCRCVICHHCQGSGKDYDPFDYSGRGFSEDCLHCGGEPLRDMCQRCADIEALEGDDQ